MRPIQTILVLEDLGNSFRGPLLRKGVRLTPDDSRTVLEVYQQWWLLMIDLGYLTLDADGKNRLQQAFTEMVNADVLDLNNAFAELLHRIRCKEITGFKALCKRINSHLYSMIKDDVKLTSLGDVYAAKRLVQVFAYTSRLSLHNIDLTQQCLEDYMKVEDNIVEDFPEPLVASLNNYIKAWLRSFDPARIRFGHGPGGVAGHGRTSLENKYKDLTSDRLLSYAFGDPWWVHVNNPDPTHSIRSSFDRVSQTIFVPKSYKTFRTISMEPATLQYCQQGVWKEIDRVVASSKFLRRRIGFHEQERNQSLARKGSIDRNYATIDLSAASDSVSYALVKRLFRGTKLLRYLVATRSRRTILPDGRLVDLKKFAPMGSALCFPIETIIFASICQYVTRGYGVAGDYSVFGDDIIVPTQCAESVMTVLTTLGFSVNRDKSFYQRNCWFRESCGGEYVDGFDVTPMRVSRKYNHNLRDVRLAGLVQMANTSKQYNFKNLRLFFLRKLRKSNFKVVFAPTAAHSEFSTNFHLHRRLNRDLQRTEFKATVLNAVPERGHDDWIRLRHWLEFTHERTSPVGKFELSSGVATLVEGFKSNVGRTAVRLKDDWVAAYDDGLDQLIGHADALVRK